MVYTFKDQEVESLTKGFIEASAEIVNFSPDVIIAPMMGAIPFIDILNAVDCGFDNEIVYYVPASSSVHKVKHVIPGTVSNILAEIVEIGDLKDSSFKVMSIDEVVGGGSAVKVYRGVTSGFTSFADKTAAKMIADETSEYDITLAYLEVEVNDDNRKDPGVHRDLSNKIAEKFKYKTIGIEHGHFNGNGKKHQSSYTELVEDGTVIPKEVERILTMDNPAFCPVKYIPKDAHTNYPVISGDFTITTDYVDLLSRIAVIAGNSGDVSPKNLQRILDHQKYIPKKYMPNEDSTA